MSGAPRPGDDSYESSYMRGAGRVLLRDKIVGKMSLALLGFVTLWCGAGAVASFFDLLPKAGIGTSAFLLAMTAFFAFLGATLSVVRSVVSEGELLVQYGLWGPRIPMRAIRSCRVVPYDWKEFGGWGIKRGADGTWAYVLRAGGDVVEVAWTAEDGGAKRALFSATDPAGVVAAVQEARGKLGTGGRARIVRGRDDEAEAEAADEAAAEADAAVVPRETTTRRE